MKLLKDLLIAVVILALWIALAWWHTKSSATEAAEMPMYHSKPPACGVRTNSYFDYDFSYNPPKLAGWRQRVYVVCPGPQGVVVIE